MTRQTTLLEHVVSLPWPIGAVLAAIVFLGSHILFTRPTDSAVVGAMYPNLLMMGKAFSALLPFAALFVYIWNSYQMLASVDLYISKF